MGPKSSGPKRVAHEYHCFNLRFCAIVKLMVEVRRCMPRRSGSFNRHVYDLAPNISAKEFVLDQVRKFIVRRCDHEHDWQSLGPDTVRRTNRS